jgi:hypothetical protein
MPCGEMEFYDVLSWFTKEFDAADLKGARVVLEELTSSSRSRRSVEAHLIKSGGATGGV